MLSVVEGELSFYSYHKAVIKIRSGKDHQQMLSIGEYFDEQDIYMVLKCLFTECLLVANTK